MLPLVRERSSTGGRAGRWRWSALAALDALTLSAAAACIIVGLVHHSAPVGAQGPLQLSVAWEPTAEVTRGRRGGPQFGDVVHATARGGEKHRAIWVYHDDALVMACPGGASCRGTLAVVIVDVVLRVHGSYLFLGLSSPAPLPVPGGSYDFDTAAAVAAGAVTRSWKLDVR